ncbi:uncharacterized protein LOC106158025 isoform X1 [Lingula anatina]|uniref:Uncharacterized protein LOC106158025 isoform X1 n=1 Tax=Lingula anatina TaxID=7574 RepID=A0A1S3HUT8_LINAN|nr:uncharacterized protein LOC106158025 isoform X1 [Lingula anatina]|eukprot:XP_013389311.1 uncharacterized protein LOC106158025 isoform X1 [Lingula anatina]
MSDARHDSNVNLKTRTNQLQATCVLTTTIMICVLIAIIALIISAVAISKPVGSEITVQGETTITQQTPQPAIAYSPSTYDASWCQASNRRRIYTVAAGYDIGPYEYNDDSGFQVGFGHDLIDAVCQEAGIDCRIVTEPYTNCMFSEKGQPERGGIGLMEGWYDACTGWLASRQRKQVFAFSKPFLKPFEVYFYALPGLNPFNITGKKIGLISGFFTNEACLAGLDQVAGRDVPHSNVFQAETLDMLLAMILNGTVDVGLSTGPAMATKINGTNIQRFPSDPMFCKNAGQPGMMTRKDNDFNSKWNEGFEKLVSSGRFKRLCDEARIKHGHRGEIDCVDA